MDQWLIWSETELLPNVRDYIIPSISYIAQYDFAVDWAETKLLIRLHHLDNLFITRTYLVGNNLTVADVNVALSFLSAYNIILNLKAQGKLINVTRWFDTVSFYLMGCDNLLNLDRQSKVC